MENDNGFYELIEKVEQAFDWTYQESEGIAYHRFDNGEVSLWISYTREFGINAEGHCPQEIKDILDEQGVNTEYVLTKW